MRRRGSIHTRLEWLEARTLAPTAPSEARQKITDFLDRLLAWRQAGCPDTEEGRELQAISAAFRRRRAELRGEGDT